jgi:glycosyltransferase involved in cell wall biosynthesis
MLMDKSQKGQASQISAARLIRPALITSEEIFPDYSLCLRRLLIGFADESIATVLICQPGCNVDSIFSTAIEIYQHPVIDLPLMEYFTAGRLIKQLEKFKPTVLHCLCESKAGLTRYIARHLDLPYILTVNSLQNRNRLSISTRQCAQIIVPTESISSSVGKFYPHLVKRIERISIGTFVEQDTTCFSSSSYLPSVVTAHPFNSVADYRFLFAALKRLSIQGYEFTFVAMGTGHAERRLWTLLCEYGLAKSVTIVPRLTPWRSVLAAGDIFIQPQPYDFFDPLLLEAMSVGSAVAACRGGVDDLIIPDETAVVFKPDDEFSVMSALQRLLDRREFARKLAKNAQQYLRDNHSVSKMIESILQAYCDAQVWYRLQK